MKKYLKWILAALAVVVMVTVLSLKSQKADTIGSVEMIVTSLQGETIADKTIEFQEGDTVISLVEENFANVKITNGMLMNIETLVTPEDWSAFICIYVNDDMSQVGIDEMKLTDGDKIAFIMTAYTPGDY